MVTKGLPSFRPWLRTEPHLEAGEGKILFALFLKKEMTPRIFQNPPCRHPLAFHCPESYYIPTLKHRLGEWNSLGLYWANPGSPTALGSSLLCKHDRSTCEQKWGAVS